MDSYWSSETRRMIDQQLTCLTWSLSSRGRSWLAEQGEEEAAPHSQHLLTQGSPGTSRDCG